ncbi:uncharacterized protein BDZ99DRAFT_561430 [Mytilinidion resinicola]|uniref:F-box domain-containing protein n=1 Tax=Mytilinidion resinicola TaxID=574789 RepID=A0A6A6YPQ1_9PEZI|nr:uncharacterized protein BDZ99DRAFT_561430 [Mytilinidion resinicola]KAF2810876.1 hypothetical protein BDZ99DRAFT_561430 [Mytilinidion resinicola]
MIGDSSIDPQLGERQYSIFSQASTLVGDSRPVDSTELLHSLVEHGALNSITDTLDIARRIGDTDILASLIDPRLIAQRERMIASLPPDLWKHILSHLDLVSAAALTIASKTLFLKLGTSSLATLNAPQNRPSRLRFLQYLDPTLPLHLLCFPCATYHLRLNPGQERLTADYTSTPLFLCPKVHSSVLPRTRLTHARALPLAFVQLVLRAHCYGPTYGIPTATLSRRWNCPHSNWRHATRYMVHRDHLLMRVVSQCIAEPKLTPTGERMLLYSREEYEPYFSVCAHWRDGVLMDVCKCALSHIPERPKAGVREVLASGPKGTAAAALRGMQGGAGQGMMVRGCGVCGPMRRCKDCASEYLVEVKMVEDERDKVVRFKHAITVTRWADLGDGREVEGGEWGAMNGVKLHGKAYDSFGIIGGRALSGIFEAEISGSIPGQRILNLNPEGAERNEEGGGWY